MALKKLCPGCGKLIDYYSRYCIDCSNKYKEKNKIRHKQYKANRTDKKEQRFYVSKAWLRFREVIKQRDKGLCKLCLSKGNIKYMDTVHHIEELKDCWDKRLNPNNLISLCESCHKKVHIEHLKGDIEKKEMQSILRKLIDGEGVCENF
ncbi:TPA: HNH endonuclease [Clostridium botulinum]|nr:HNH endonuclease [Clostridium botulinum]